MIFQLTPVPFSSLRADCDIQTLTPVPFSLLEAVPKQDFGRIGKLVRAINRYVTLNPNVFGIGVDINRILDDVSSDSE